MRKYLAVLVFFLTCGSAFGALQVASGTFAVPVSTGSVTCTTLMGGACTTFTPKALLLFGSYATADGFKTHADVMFSMSDCSSGSHISVYSEDAANPSQESFSVTTTPFLYHANGAAATVQISATFTSCDSDGFTVNFTDVTAGAGKYLHWAALGGSDITNVAMGSAGSGTETPTETLDINTLGFQPNFVLLLQNMTNALGGGSNLGFGIGASDCTNEWAIAFAGDDASTTTDTAMWFHATKGFLVLNSTSGALIEEGDISCDSAGFNVGLTTAASGARQFIYLAIKGGQWGVGNGTQKTSAGTQAYTTTFQPEFLFVGSANTITAGSEQAGAYGSLGVALSTSNRRSVWFGSEDNIAAGSQNADSSSETDEVIQMEDDSTLGPDAEADLSSFNPTNFTLNWTTADAVARYLGWVVAASNASTGSARPQGDISSGMTQRLSGGTQ